MNKNKIQGFILGIIGSVIIIAAMWPNPIGYLLCVGNFVLSTGVVLYHSTDNRARIER